LISAKTLDGSPCISFGSEKWERSSAWKAARGVGANSYRSTCATFAARLKMTVRGKVILITGAARGVGQAAAAAFCKEGANVLAADIRNCEQTKSLALGCEGRIEIAHLDVTDQQSAQAAVAQAVSAFGRLDALVNNAALYGGLKTGRFEELAEREWDAVMTVNVKGIWNCCKAAVPAMRQLGAGSIVNMASMAGTYGTPFMLHYTTSKAAVIGLTRGLARELGREAIRVNAIAPTAIVTEGTREVYSEKAEKALDAAKKLQSIPSNLMPEDLIGTIAWLVSDASCFVTGQTIAVDGGTIMS
jgi:NAD(P)-dependent dehydrogenase (short-subunit alcohol dehydrogenase family)